MIAILCLHRPLLGPASNSYLLYNFGQRSFLSMLQVLLLIHGGCNDTILIKFYEVNMRQVLKLIDKITIVITTNL